MNEITPSLALRFLRRALRSFGDERTPELKRYPRLFDAAIREMARLQLIPRSLTEGDYPAESLRLAKHKPHGSDLAYALNEALWQMITMGYLVPKPSDQGPLEFFGMHVTDTGRAWAAAEEPVPEDAEGYLAAVRDAAPQIDPVVVQYLSEAVATYRGRAFFAAAVMIGAASEFVVHQVAASLLESLGNEKERQNLRQEIKRNEFEKILTRLSKVLARATEPQGPIPYEVHEGVDRHLSSLLESIRKQRNVAGHPTGVSVRPVAVRLALSAFPGACGKAYDLSAWLAQNPRSI